MPKFSPECRSSDCVSSQQRNSELLQLLQTSLPSFSEIDTALGREQSLKADAIRAVAIALRDARRERGLSQLEMAARLNISQPAISKFEKPNLEGDGASIGTIVKYLNQCGFQLSLNRIPIKNGHSLQKHSISSSPNSVTQTCDALNSLDICYLETDSNDRIVKSNGCWKKLHRRIKPWTDNVMYEDFLKAGIDANLFPASQHDSDWLLKRLEMHRNPTEPFEVERQRNVLLEVSESRNNDGGTVTIGKDVSYKKVIRSLSEQV